MKQDSWHRHDRNSITTEAKTKAVSPSRILIVDDAPEAVRLLEKLLHVHGYHHVCSTTDPRQVATLFRQFQPDLILLDLMMPHLDGFQVMAQLNALRPLGTFLPIVALTALTDAASKERALQAGAHDFLTKPFLISEVLLRIRNLLQLRELNLRLQEQNRDLAIFGEIVDSSHDAIISKTLEGIITSWNPGAEKLFGYSAAEAVGQPVLMLFPPDRQHEENFILAQQSRGQRIDHFETVRVRKDGQSIDVSLTLSPITDGQKNIIGVSKIARDITERKRAEAEREELLVREQRARYEAEEANLAKSEFLSRMSHELRTPLNAILGFGQIMEMRSEGADLQQKENIAQILKGGRHLLSLVNEVLDIARVEAGRVDLSLEPLALDEIVPEVGVLVAPLAAQRGIRLDYNPCKTGESDVVADRQRLQQVLLNLLSNAIKYNREGGLVEVSCEVGPEGVIAIVVRDTGMGIAPHDLPKLFAPFERLKAGASGVEGTGLGLVLSKRLVAAMEGSIEVESTLGHGTTFTIKLPQAPSPEKRGVNQPASNSLEDTGVVPLDTAPQTSSVLCIEDNPSNLRLIETVLQSRPQVMLLPAVQGSIGLELARQHSPDLILLDLHLPDMTGAEVLAHLRQSHITRDIPVIVISADATGRQIQRLLEAGAMAYLTKPLNVPHFLSLLDEVLLSQQHPL